MQATMARIPSGSYGMPQRLIGGIAGHVDAAADLTEHLDDDLHRVLNGLGQVELGPGSGVGVTLAAEGLVPQLVGPKRADGRQDAHDILSHAVAQRLVAPRLQAVC